MASSLFQLGTTAPNIDKGVNTTAVSTGGIATGTQNVFIINKTNAALNIPVIVSSDADLTHNGEFPRVLQSGESYRFTATAAGPAHSLSFAANTITSTHTYVAVDEDNARDNNNQRVYLDQID